MSSSESGRLLGLMAFCMGLIDQQKLDDVCDAPAETTDQEIRERLARHGGLSPDELSVLEQGVKHLLARHGNDAVASLAALAQGPATGTPSGTSISHTIIMTPRSAPPHPGRVVPTVREAERYRVVRSHAAGGLGEVFVALDVELERDVALKEIREIFADDPESRLRFIQEAQVTGRLEHPGVVPVYGLGRYPDGRPYYAMRFIGGESLQQAIRRFHEADQNADRNRTERELELRELLSRFLAVCDTLGYAHSRGVVHRDIKPANIMLGEFGETLVVDWGLAKVLGSVPVGENDSTPPPPVMESGSATQTQVGAAVGTPAYMSPEQALAAHDRVGPVSDIYSLGVVLYELLTGKRAIAPNVVDAVLQAVIAGDIPPLRSVNPRVPPALEAICMKAASRRPEDRYQNTIALARDIKAWLADEPVAAWREPWAVRGVRWIRRHQKLVTGISAAALVALVSLTLGIMAQAAANRQITTARNRAERAFTGLRSASDNFMDVVEQHLIRQSETSPDQQRMLETGLAMYEQFLAEEPRDMGVREQLAATELRVARIRYRLGQFPEAGQHAAAAVEGYAGLSREAPGSAAYLRGWAESEIWRGETLRPHDPGAAEAAYLAGQSVAERVRHEFGDQPQDRALAAKTNYNLGLLRHALNRLDESEQSYRAAIDLLAPLRNVAAETDQMDHRQHLARAYVDLGMLLRERGQPVAAAENCQLGIALYSEIAEQHDVEPEVHYERATARMNLGNLYFVNRRASEMGPEPLQRAEAAYRESIFELQQLTRRYPGVPTYRKELANCHNGLGSALQQAGRIDDAKQSWSTARDLFEELAAESPQVADFHNLLGLTQGNLALLARGSAPREAIYLWTSAIDHAREALRINPQHPAYRRFLAGHYRSLIPLHIDAGELDAAADRIDQMATDLSSDATALAFAAQFCARGAGASEVDAQRDQFRRRSLALLNQAIAAGYSDRATLENHADFAAVRDTGDFRSLLKRLPPPATPPTSP